MAKKTRRSATPLTVAPGTSLADTLAAMHAAGTRLAAVTGRASALLGTVTDAAIRRAALKGAALDTAVDDVMTTRPVIVPAGTKDADVLAVLNAYRLSAVPVVDGKRLAGVRLVTEFPGAAPPAPVAVVMAGGRGQRLRPLTDKVPKPLLKIGGESILERIIRNLAAAGVTEVWLTLNYKAEQFEKRIGDGSHLGVTAHHVREPKVLGTAGSLSLLPEVPDVPVIVTNGDLVTTIDYASLFEFHWHHGAAITVTGVEHLTHVPYGVLRTVEHHLLGIDEKPDRRDVVSAGMYVLDPEVLRFVPPGTALGMPDLIDAVLAEGLPVHVFPVLERWFDIGSPEEFEHVLMQFATGEEE